MRYLKKGGVGGKAPQFKSFSCFFKNCQLAFSEILPSVCTIEAILNKYFTELAFRGLPLVASLSNTVNTMEGNGNS